MSSICQCYVIKPSTIYLNLASLHPWKEGQASLVQHSFDIIKSDTVTMMMAAMEDWCKLWIIPVATGERIPVSKEVRT